MASYCRGVSTVFHPWVVTAAIQTSYFDYQRKAAGKESPIFKRKTKGRTHTFIPHSLPKPTKIHMNSWKTHGIAKTYSKLHFKLNLEGKRRGESMYFSSELSTSSPNIGRQTPLLRPSGTRTSSLAHFRSSTNADLLSSSSVDRRRAQGLQSAVGWR